MLQGYHYIRYGNSLIQVKWDDRPQKYWFVVLDVLACLFDHPHFYWQKIKEKIAADGKRNSDYFITCTYGKETIDIADYLQIIYIFTYVPGRIIKKEKILAWMRYPMPPDFQDAIIQTYQRKDEVGSKWDNIIDRAERYGVRPETIISYIEKEVPKIIEQKKLKEESRKLEIASQSDQTSESQPSEDDSPSYSPQEQKKKNSELKETLIAIGVMLGFWGIGAIIYITNYLLKHIASGVASWTIRHPDTPFILFGIFAVLSAIIIYCLFNDPMPIIFPSLYNTADDSSSDDISLPFIDKITNCESCNQKIPFEYDRCPYCGANRIWNIIKELTTLALSDRILTDLERETIVNKAVEGGISLKEINRYLDEQISIRLQSYSKADLCACPHCGGQIPLLSQRCLYCGNELEHNDHPIIVPSYVISKEAEIIRSENSRVEETRHGIKNCPDCGATFPLVSNICTSCGHILHERTENFLNIKNLHYYIMMSFNRINSAPHPKVYQIVRYWSVYILLAISMFTFALGCYHHSDIGKIGASVGLVLCIVLMIVDSFVAKTKSPVLIADEEFQKAQQSYEMYARQIKTLYGNNFEAKKLLKQLSESIDQIQEERNIKRRRVYYIMGCLSLMILIAITYFSA